MMGQEIRFFSVVVLCLILLLCNSISLSILCIQTTVRFVIYYTLALTLCGFKCNAVEVLCVVTLKHIRVIMKMLQ